MNSYPPKHNATFEVPLMYLRIILTIFQCPLPNFAMNQLTTPIVCAMSGLVQIITKIKLSTTDAYSVQGNSIISASLLGLILENNL